MFSLSSPLRASIATIVACLAFVSGFAAEPGTKTFNIPPGDADRTLREYSTQSGVQVIYPTGIVRGVSTNAVRGEMSPQAALDTMLAGTRLVAVHDDRSGTITVRRETAEESKNVVSRRAPGPAASGDEPIHELDPFTVTNSPTKGYMATNTISGTAMNTPLREVPMAINVITSEFLDDALVGKTMADAFAYNSSITQTFRPGFGGVYAMFAIRGYLTRNILIDGIQGGNEVPTYAIDRIEVVKGPNTLYSLSDPGGLVNIVTKRPTGSGTAVVTQKYGRYTGGGEPALIETQLDVDMAPIRDRLRLRVIGNYNESGAWRPIGGIQRDAFVGLMADYELTSQTKLLAHVSGRRNSGVNIEGIRPFERLTRDLNGDGDTSDVVRGVNEASVLINNTYLPWSYNGQTNRDWFVEKDEFIQTGIQHRFNESISAQYMFNHTSLHRSGSARAVNNFLPNGTAVPSYAANENQLNKIDAHTLNFLLSFVTGRIEHRVLAGGRTSTFYNQGDNYQLNPAVAAHRAVIESLNAAGRNIPLVLRKDDILAGRQDWLDDTVTYQEILALGSRNNNVAYSTTDHTSFYVTDSMSFGDGRLKVTAGLRHIRAEDESVNLNGTKASNPINQADTSGQLGVVYALNPQINAYVNVANGYNPNPYNNSTNEFFPAETSKAYEIGLKFEDLWQDRLSGSLSAFDIRKKNVVTSGTDLVTNLPFTELAESGARGFEMELFLNVTNNWNAVLGYSYLDARVLDSRTLPTDLPLEGAPPHRLTLWSSYRISSGPLEGLRFGGGLVWADGPIQQFGNSPNAHVLEDGYTQVDLFARYETRILERDVSWGLNVVNATDAAYLRARALTSTPRRVVLSARIEL